MPKANDVPKCPAVPSAARIGVTGDQKSFKIQLITPMFGGGVRTRTIDGSMPIRVSSIRGQLQFWWRATVGAQYEKLEELRAAQSAIWGSTDRSSRVQICVRGLKHDQPLPCASIDWNATANRGRGAWRLNWKAPFANTALPYALFPFQGTLPSANMHAQIEQPPAMCIHNASFDLLVRCPTDIWPQVERAIWAWTNFGGLGSRTRRGCGSIACKDFQPASTGELSDRWRQYMLSQHPVRQWPTLAESCLSHGSSTDSVRAWHSSIDLLRSFRQGVGVGRNPGQEANRPGRSRFSEPETIRRITGRRPNQHQRLTTIPDNAFPRAPMGLPIVFHFPPGTGEPPDTVLYPDSGPDGKPRERMASPFILKPLALANGKSIPLFVQLKTVGLTGVDLRNGDQSLALPSPTILQGGSLSTYPNSPLSSSLSGSVIEAFIAYARSAGFTTEISQ